MPEKSERTELNEITDNNEGGCALNTMEKSIVLQYAYLKEIGK